MVIDEFLRLIYCYFWFMTLTNSNDKITIGFTAPLLLSITESNICDKNVKKYLFCDKGVKNHL